MKKRTLKAALRVARRANDRLIAERDAARSAIVSGLRLQADQRRQLKAQESNLALLLGAGWDDRLIVAFENDDYARANIREGSDLWESLGLSEPVSVSPACRL